MKLLKEIRNRRTEIKDRLNNPRVSEKRRKGDGFIFESKEFPNTHE